MGDFTELQESLIRLGFNEQQVMHLGSSSECYGDRHPMLLYASRPAIGFVRCRFEFKPSGKEGRQLIAHLSHLGDSGKWVELIGRIFPDNLSIQEVMAELKITFPAIIELNKPLYLSNTARRIARRHKRRHL